MAASQGATSRYTGNYDLPKVPTWRLEWSSNLRPCGCKTTNLPRSHNVPKLRSAQLGKLISLSRDRGEPLSSAWHSLLLAQNLESATGVTSMDSVNFLYCVLL